MGQHRMDFIDKIAAWLNVKALAATSGAAVLGGAATERAPRLSEAVWFHLGRYAVTLPDIAVCVAVLSGLLAIFRPAIMSALRRWADRP